MPFDPNIPAANAELTSAMFRGQFTGLKELIDNMSGITSAVVDAVNTLPPGTPAAVSMNVVGNELHFTFGIPQGNEGPQGQTGGDGIQGPPFANAVVDAVNTLPPGSNAAVNVSFDGTNVHFTFAIPQGHEGPTGATGQPGEVSQGDLNAGLLNNLSQCSNNSNLVASLGLTMDTTYDQNQAQMIVNKIDELISALRR